MEQGAIVSITKEMFLEMKIQDKIGYLNEKLQEGMNVTEIRAELGIGEKKLRKLLKENGYKFNQKTKRYESSSKVNYKDSAEVNYKSSAVVNIDQNKSSDTDVVDIDNKLLLKIINELNDVKQMNTKVVEMYEWYEKQINVIEPQQLIINSRENNSTTVKSYKVYCETERAFQSLCKKYSHLKVQDLISKALDEFVEKYK